MISVNFNGVALDGLSGVTLTGRNVNDPPKREVRLYKKARSDSSIMTSAEYSDKTIVITGFIGGDNQDDTENKYNTLLSYVQATNADLILVRAGISLTYKKVSLSQASINTFTGGFVSFELMFTAADPIGLESTSSQLIQPKNIVASSYSATISPSGSYKALPVITLQISTVTGGTTKAITIANATTGVGITVTRTWANGEILTIDCLNKTVMVSNGSVAFTGAFPSFDIGNGSVTYIDTFTTRSVVLSAVYQRRYV